MHWLNQFFMFKFFPTAKSIDELVSVAMQKHKPS